jgi:hypothetical protein
MKRNWEAIRILEGAYRYLCDRRIQSDDPSLYAPGNERFDIDDAKHLIDKLLKSL